MSLVVVGINHRTAPVEVRERVVFEPARVPEALRELATLPAVQESLIVSTCNRTEIYCATETGDAGVGDWLQRYHQLGASIHHCLYRHEDMRAVAHVFAVASGLDSLVLGEPQILGQLKDAYRAAQEAGTTGPLLNRLFQAAFSVAKRVRTETEIGANAVSVAYAAVRMARTVFASFDNRTALLVGAGDTIALAARHLHADGLRRMIVANRSVERARELAAEFKGFAIGLDDIPSHLREADIVIASTASPNPIVTRAMAEDALRARKRRPIFMVDIAVPRDIEPEVAELEDIYLFTIDDLQTVVNENMEGRRQAAREAGPDDRVGGRSLRDADRARRQAAPTIRPSARSGGTGAAAHAGPGAPHDRGRPQRGRSARVPLGHAHQPPDPRAEPAAAGRRRDRRRCDHRHDRRHLPPRPRLMKDSIRRRLETTVERFEELGALLAEPDVRGKPGRFRDLSVEYARLEPVASASGNSRAWRSERRTAAEMAAGADAEMRELAEEELRDLDARLESESAELAKLLLPKDPRDERNIFLEIRAGTGGDEAAIFAGRPVPHVRALRRAAGLAGRDPEREPGRARRLPRGDQPRGRPRRRTRSSSSSPARIACSACRRPRRRVASTPRPAPWRSCRNSTKSTTSRSTRRTCASTPTAPLAPAASTSTRPTRRSASRTCRPGIVVECQDERSQHKNRSRAMSLLRARLLEAEQEKQAAQQAQARKLQVGSGDRSERIRTYNFPQGRVTDHRINLTLYQLPAVMDGALDELIGPLQQEWQAEQLASLQ